LSTVTGAVASSFKFDRDTEVIATDEGWSGTIQPGWRIGPNPNGGYLLALVLRALQSVTGRPDPLSVTAYYLSPPTIGPVSVQTEAVKSGRTLATAAGRLIQDGRERVRVVAAFGDLDSMTGPTHLTLRPPVIDPPERCITLAESPAFRDHRPPEFGDRVEMLFPPGAAWMRAEESAYDGWIRFRDGRQPDVISLPLFADAFPPPVVGIVPAGWVPTIELTVHVRGRPRPGWLLGSFRTQALVDGLMETDCELWDESGQLVVMARQLAMVLAPTHH
jgi:acyl-CoA thioesterase